MHQLQHMIAEMPVFLCRENCGAGAYYRFLRLTEYHTSHWGGIIDSWKRVHNFLRATLPLQQSAILICSQVQIISHPGTTICSLSGDNSRVDITQDQYSSTTSTC